MTLWGARFSQDSSSIFSEINRSLDTDYVLVQHDIQASIAWVQALKKADVLASDEESQIKQALETLSNELSQPERLEAIVQSDAEDIHTWIEWQLIAKIGDLGKKVHTGRSRNDQVITAFKLWIKQQTLQINQEINSVIESLCSSGLKHIDTVMPGFTHLQLAQPMSVGHWLHAHAEGLSRDLNRLNAYSSLHNQCPLGSAALTGNAFAIDREAIAESLDFDGPTWNSLDTVSTRDFVSDLIYCASQSLTHLSKFAEDCIVFGSDQLGFISLGDTTTSGSSIMPQKKNPDSLEMVRGLCGQTIGDLAGFHAVIKGIPSGYNKDLQVDKTTLMTVIYRWSLCLNMVKEVVDSMSINAEKMLKAVNESFCNATEAADYLALKGVPFRDAHSVIGSMVNDCEQQNKVLADLTLEQMQSYNPAIQADIFEWLQPKHAVNRRSSIGGTAVKQVKRNIANTLIHSGVASIQKAQFDDVQAIAKLIAHWAAAGEHLPRSNSQIFNQLHQFWVIKTASGNIIACASLVPMSQSLVEIRSLGLEPAFQGSGLGQALTAKLESAAYQLGFTSIFALTRIARFFEKVGYHQVSLSSLPHKVLQDCQHCPKKHACDEVAMLKPLQLPSLENAA